MIIDVSLVQKFARCQRKWWVSAIGGIQEPPSPALQDGIRWHELVAGETPLTPGDPPWMQKGLEQYLRLLQTGDYKVLAAEHPLAAYLTPDTMLIGRVDALVEWNGKCWNLQHKSVRASMPLGRYFQDLARSWHENAYAWLHEETRARGDDPKLSKLPFGGSLIVLARKLTRGDNVLTIQPVPVTAVDAVIAELRDYARSMQTGWFLGPAVTRPNRDACFSPFGHSPCYLLPYCDWAGGGPHLTSSHMVEIARCGVRNDPTAHYDATWKELMWSRLMMPAGCSTSSPCETDSSAHTAGSEPSGQSTPGLAPPSS